MRDATEVRAGEDGAPNLDKRLTPIQPSAHPGLTSVQIEAARRVMRAHADRQARRSEQRGLQSERAR